MKLTENRIALVTGASSGIGKAIALRFGAEGIHVIVNYLTNEKAADEVVQKIRDDGGRADKIMADISYEDEVQNMFSFIKTQFGKLDILVNNAGRQKDRSFTEMSLADWKAVIDVDLTGHFLCAREASKIFINQYNEKDERSAGVIIFITSVHENIPWAKRANYCAAKGGASMLMKTVAQEMAPYKIRANSVAPGAVKTAINKENFDKPKTKEQIMRKIPYGRAGKVEDIASAVVWLASDEADYVTGETLFVDGGMELFADFAHGG